MNKTDRILSLLGLAQKAGKIASGELPCENAVRSQTAFLVILSEDASAGTQKKFSNRCHFYEVPMTVIGADKMQLGHAIGKEQRSCLAVCDEGFAMKLRSLCESQDV